MHNLTHIQQSFYAAVFQTAHKNLSFISSSLAGERFAVYRQTIFDNLQNALKITFPGIWKLLGEECADSVAHAFCHDADNLPKTGCLDDFGETFPSFLGGLHQLSSHPYLNDYASYEWLKHKAYCAAEAKAIAPTDLQDIPEARIDHVKFTFLPSCFVFSSPYPIPDIHEIANNSEADSLTFNNQGSYGIITRLHDEVCMFWVSKGLWTFINCLAHGSTLSESADHAQGDNSVFDLTEAISFILQKQLVYKILDNIPSVIE